ncbi:MAG: response regulator transcription factor [bacterium]
MRLLLVEDEKELRDSLARQLREKGFAVDVCDNGHEAVYLGTEFEIDLAIVDIGLPDISGIEVIEKLRDKDRKFPILVLTARSDWHDKVEALNQGADDYLTKPFHVEELLARVNALIRRMSGETTAELRQGPISVDTHKQLVKVNNVEIELTSFEYKVLEYLMLNSEKVVSKTVLTEHIYDQDFDRDSNVIEVFIGRLRKKLDPDGTLKPIETLRGRGYRLSTQ